MSNHNAALNAFLAVLEERPEDARQMFGSLPERVPPHELANIHGRIRQAAENIKCDAIKEAIRKIWDQTLRLQSRHADGPVPAVENAFYEGVQAVEEILAEVLKTCESTRKQLGPRA